MKARTLHRSSERILVRCPNWLGDVVMSTPGLHALRRAKPAAWIVGQLPADLAPLLDGLGVCDEFWPVEPRSEGLRALHAEARRVAAFRFDLGVLVPESISSALRMRWGRVAHIVGFARDPVRRFLLDDVVAAPSEWGRRRMVSRERFVAELMNGLGAPTEDLQLRLDVTPAEEARLQAVLTKHGISRGQLDRDPPIVFAPGARFGPSKCWPAAHFAELADRFVARGRCVILLGGPGEGAILATVRDAMQTDTIVLDGSLDLGSLKALMLRTGMLIANDAGARHVAAAFGVPSVIFFGPTSVEKTGDNLDRIEVLETNDDCRPCYRRTCPIDHRCLVTISVNAADAAASRLIEKGGAVRLQSSPAHVEWAAR